mgnify:FL=1
MPASANALDRLIGWIDPRRGIARHAARARLEHVQRAYEAASPRDKWKPRRAGASPAADHLADAATLRTKARALRQNVPYIAAGMQALVDATVGTGVVIRATGREAAAKNKTFAAWKPECDADGRLDFDGMVAAAYDTTEQDGEVLIRLRPRLPSDGLAVPLQLQLLEIDWLDTTKTVAVGANQVIEGIEYDPLGAVAAYWLYDSHPGDIGTVRASGRTQSRRISAQFIIHLFRAERPGQGRGFTRIAPVIARVRDLQLYEDAELARKNLESRLGVVYSGNPEDLANPGPGNPTGDPAQARVTGDLGELPSGGITGLPMGGAFEIVEPKPAAGYTDYVKQQLHLIAAGMGITYEMMTGDVSEANFSSARVRLLDFRRGVERIRWLTLKPRLLDRLWVAFVDYGIAGGVFRTFDYGVAYSFPKFDYVDPDKDVKADIAEVAAGLSSLSEKLRQRGYEPNEVYTEIAADFNRLRELGVLDILLQLQTGKPVAPAAEADPAPAPAPKRAAPTAPPTPNSET